MKTRFVLPAAFALTLHAFLLFGLTDKPVQAGVAQKDPASDDRPKIVSVDPPEDAPKIKDPDEDPPGEPEKLMPRLQEFIPVTAPFDGIPIPPLRRVTDTGHGNVIAVHWQGQPEPGAPQIIVFKKSELDSAPRARAQPPPIYPPDLRRDGIEGTVVVDFKVDLDGNVYSATVLSATHRGFIDATLQAVGRWKFEPGRRTGQKVRFLLSVPVVFSIHDK